MHLSRREFLDTFLGFVGESGDDTARNVAERLLNRVVTRIWTKHPWTIYRSPVPFQLTLTVNQARYSLPDYFGRIGPGRVRNLTRGLPILQLQPGQLERDFPDAGTLLEVPSLPSYYDIGGMSGVHTQPAVTGDALEVLSDNAGDTDIKVAIAGDDPYGNWTRNQVTLTGTTPVSIGTWSFVDEFGKAYQASSTPVTELMASRGNVTLRKVSGGTELQKLFPQDSARENSIITFYPKPNVADVVGIPLIRRPKRMIFDADVFPDLWEPAIHEEMLIEWQVNRGDLTAVEANEIPRPAFLDLLCEENRARPRPVTRPYSRS